MSVPTSYEIIVTVDNASVMGCEEPLSIPYLCDHKIFCQLVTETKDPQKWNALVMGSGTHALLRAKKSYAKIEKQCLEIIVKHRALPEDQKDVGSAKSFIQAVQVASQMPEIERVFVIGGPKLINTAYKTHKWKHVHIFAWEGTFEKPTVELSKFDVTVGKGDPEEDGYPYAKGEHTFNYWFWTRTAPMSA
jgi:dihydrofolate reductase